MTECLRLSELANYLTPQALTQADLAVIYGDLGAIEQALEIVHLALAVAEAHVLMFRPYVMSRVAQLHLRQGQLREAEAAIDQGKKEFKKEGNPLFFQFVFHVEAELALRQGDYEHALALTGDLLVFLNQFGMRAYLPEALYLRGQILGGMGQTEAAHNTWLEARTEAEAIGSRRMLWQILAALSRLESDPAEANRLQQQAQEIVESIAANIGDPGLRRSFLNLAEVQEVISADCGVITPKLAAR
jgi:tetratricopeptide (TPR) repeat protein